ncbi:CBS domain protein [Humitalea rosea]|uniref:CBS domain protein n=1 Tax=Humitalea rosea TaxID=990373 RepID=A0A2W7IWM2_9PROT|nr:CBS domain-containing protein [Humitalea rosea]PZW43093.1 CBS domain protein [Humitalea rosea]
METNRHMEEVIVRRAPVTMRPDTTVQDACREMRAQRIGAVLVTDVQGHLLGIFTGRDAVCRIAAEGRDAAKTTLAEVMTEHPDTMGPQARAVEALRVMRDAGFRHMPVVEGDRLLGVVSRGDFQATEEARLENDTYLWERL